MSNLNTIERQYVKRIYAATGSIDLAVTAIAIRRLNPKLQMNSADLAGLIIELNEDITTALEDASKP